MFFAFDVTLAGAAAFLLAVSGVITSFIALRKAKQEGDVACHDQLKSSRAEAEMYAQELHKIRLEHPELMPPSDEGRAIFWLIVSIGMFALATAITMWIIGLPSGSPGAPKRISPNRQDTTTTIVVVPGTGTNGVTGDSSDTGAKGSPTSVGSLGVTSTTGPQGPCPLGYSVTVVELKVKTKTVLAAICVAK
jgi:hypothetical protein